MQSIKQQSTDQLIESVMGLPKAITSAYLAQSSFWLSWMPMRGFLAFCESPLRTYNSLPLLHADEFLPNLVELANLIKLILMTST